MRGITKKFGGLVALTAVDFTVNSGETVGLIGPNGAGKTTLFNVLTGFIKPDEGTISFNGQDITGLKSYQICRKGIARTFQLVRPFRDCTVLENVIDGAFLHTNSLSEARLAATSMLKLMGLADRLDSPAKELNLIDLKRIELARALATRPKLLLLDEFFTGLNQSEIEDAKHIINELLKSGLTIVIVEHVMSVVMTMSNRVVVLDHGKKIAEGTPTEVVGDKMVIDSYLGRRWRHHA